jgi:hypothetical protein
MAVAVGKKRIVLADALQKEKAAGRDGLQNLFKAWP